MNASEILSLRLHNTGLRHSPFISAADAVTHLGAVQAQDFAAAKWALGLRIKNATDEEIENAFNAGTILRTHVMRPTWHFVRPEDIRWMLEVTAPRVKSLLAPYNRRLGLDDALFARSNAAILRALEGRNYLTRQELKTVLADTGIVTDVQRLSHILARAELDRLICSGPRRGKQFTYALMEERVPTTEPVEREPAIAKLALTYFTSHGPAQLKDFAWWSGLTARDAKAALGLISSHLLRAESGGRIFWYPPPAETPGPDLPAALLLSIYDEYTIAYTDRSDIRESRDIGRMIAQGAAVTAVIVLNGRVAGSWSKTRKGQRVEIRLNPFRKLDRDEHEALKSEVTRYGGFWGIPAKMEAE
jgi:hypothetical protein